MRAKQSKTLSLVFNRFLRGPVGIRGLMGGEHGRGEFIRCSEYRFLTDWRTQILRLAVVPFGPNYKPCE